MSLITGEIKIKTTVSYHLTPHATTITKKRRRDKWWRKGSRCTLLVGMLIGVASVKNSRVPQSRIELSYDSQSHF